MYYIGLGVHKKTISYCVKDVSGGIQQQGTIPATRTNLDGWVKTLLSRGWWLWKLRLHRMDLQSSAAACCTGEGGASIDAAGERSIQEEERQD